MKKLGLSLILVLLFVSCDLDDDDSGNFSVVTLPIKSSIVPEEFNFGMQHTITVTYELPNGCHSFYNLFYQYEDTSRIVAINALLNEELACTEAIIEMEYTFLVNVVQKEDYIFKFWKGLDEGGENIFEEIRVRVNEIK